MGSSVSVSETEKFFEPSSVAIVGASRTRGKAGNIILSNLIEFGYRGDVFPVNPGADEIFGFRAFHSLLKLPVVPDLVVGVLPRDKSLALLEDCARIGAKNVIIPAAGFSDAGFEGKDLERRLVSFAQKYGIRLMGPNSIGTISTGSGLCTSIVTLKRLRRGSVSLFGQTGMFSSGMARWINTEENYGISKIACLGNKGGLDEGDILDYLAVDGTTRVIGLYTEGVRRGREFARALQSAARTKPVLVLKSGKNESGRRAIESHTGALAGNEEIFDAVIRQFGGIRVRDFEDMFDIIKGFELLPLPEGDGVGVASITGVGCVLAADAASEFQLSIPPLSRSTIEMVSRAMPSWAPISNPADLWVGIEERGPVETYGVAVRALAADPAVHSLVVIFTLIPESNFDVARLFSEVRESFPGKPVVAVLFAGDVQIRRKWKRKLERLGIPTYPTPERAMRVIGAMREFSRRLGGKEIA